MTTQFGPASGEWKTRPFHGTVATVGPALIYSGLDLDDPDEDGNEEESESAAHPAIDIGRAQGMDYVEVSQGSRRARFETGPLGKPFAALNSCSDDLLRSWGLDLEKHCSLSRRGGMDQPPAHHSQDRSRLPHEGPA
ncbi:MAG: hypothetical protein ACR2FJ_01615 [Qipengyuania sp.]